MLSCIIRVSSCVVDSILLESQHIRSPSDCWVCSGYPHDGVQNRDTINKVNHGWHVLGWGMNMGPGGLSSGSAEFPGGSCNPRWDGYFIRVPNDPTSDTCNLPGSFELKSEPPSAIRPFSFPSPFGLQRQSSCTLPYS